MEEMKNTVEPVKRPGLLTVTCILTFIGSGLGLLSYLLLTVAFGVMVGVLDSIPGMGAIAAGGIGLFIVSLILSAISLYGAIQMWKLKKLGFYLYTGAQVLMLIVPMIFVQGASFSFVGLFFTALFIALYAINLKVME